MYILVMLAISMFQEFMTEPNRSKGISLTDNIIIGF